MNDGRPALPPLSGDVSVKLAAEGKGLRGTGPPPFFVVMTFGRGRPPDVRVDGSGPGAKVTVGGRAISFDGDSIVFRR